jgi:hypothetical protein
MKRRGQAVLVAVLLACCGGDATEPTGPSDHSGRWTGTYASGTLSFTVSGSNVTSFSFSHNGSCGAATATSGALPPTTVTSEWPEGFFSSQVGSTNAPQNNCGIAGLGAWARVSGGFTSATAARGSISFDWFPCTCREDPSSFTWTATKG